MRIVLKCVREVPPFFDALLADDDDQLRVRADAIFQLEHEADQAKHAIRSALPRSLFMPVDRRDLLEVLHMQDCIADTAQDIAGIFLERPMKVPEHMREQLRALVAECLKVCERCGEVMESLDELLEVGFRGRQAARVEEMIEELGKAEDVTDELGMALARSLFKHEADLDPVSVMLWYQIVQWIGDLADYSEKAADRLRLIIAS